MWSLISRVLLPNWRFFEADDARYLLEVRVAQGEQAPSSFMAAIPPVRRSLLALVFAPEHNLRLACHELVDRFVLELAEQPRVASEVETLASWARVRHMARYFLRSKRALGRASGDQMREPSADLRFQLRLLALDVSADDASHELFLSPYYPLS